MTGVLLLLWWCDVAVDLQTDKTQCSDTWWAAPEHESVVARGGQAETWYAGQRASWDNNSVLSSPVCPPCSVSSVGMRWPRVDTRGHAPVWPESFPRSQCQLNTDQRQRDYQRQQHDQSQQHHQRQHWTLSQGGWGGGPSRDATVLTSFLPRIFFVRLCILT